VLALETRAEKVYIIVRVRTTCRPQPPDAKGLHPRRRADFHSFFQTFRAFL